MKYLFTCGGTAGHINPALAVADRLKEIDPGSEFLFIGVNGMMETELVPLSGYQIQTIDVMNISRDLSWAGIKHNFQAMSKVIRSTRASKKIIKSFAPDIVIGTGGYVCYPVIKSAHKLKIPTLVHESNAVPGLTTKLLSRIVDCVLVGFESAVDNYPKHINVQCIGTPVRRDFGLISKEEARKKLGLPIDKPLLVSVWGSLGSAYINHLIPELSSCIMKRQSFCFIHSTGKNGYQSVVDSLKPTTVKELSQCGIDIRDYIYDMSLVMTAADLVACRSGASTLSELAYMGKPALLVPSPNVTNNHQEKNARMLEKKGAAVVLLEKDLDSKRFFDEIESVLYNKELLDKMACAMKKCCIQDATDRFTKVIRNYL